MIYTYFQDTDRIELVMSGKIEREEFRQITHQISSLCAMYPAVKVLIDATAIEGYDFRIALDEFKFLKEHETRLETVIIVSDRKVFDYLSRVLNRIVDVEVSHHLPQDLEKVRDMVFPSLLPA